MAAKSQRSFLVAKVQESEQWMIRQHDIDEMVKTKPPITVYESTDSMHAVGAIHRFSVGGDELWAHAELPQYAMGYVALCVKVEDGNMVICSAFMTMFPVFEEQALLAAVDRKGNEA